MAALNFKIWYNHAGDAVERWRSKLNVTGLTEDAQRDDQAGDADEGAEPPVADEYAFLGDEDLQRSGDAQTLAPATQEQATAAEAVDATGDELDEPTPAVERDTEVRDAEEQVLPDQSLRAAGPAVSDILDAGELDASPKKPDPGDAVLDLDVDFGEAASERAARDSYIASLLARQAGLRSEEPQLGAILSPIPPKTYQSGIGAHPSQDVYETWLGRHRHHGKAVRGRGCCD